MMWVSPRQKRKEKDAEGGETKQTDSPEKIPGQVGKPGETTEGSPKDKKKVRDLYRFETVSKFRRNIRTLQRFT